jgi:hypothetical protein
MYGSRYAVYYQMPHGAWQRYGIPFGTMSGALSCAARLAKTENLRCKIEVVR